MTTAHPPVSRRTALVLAATLALGTSAWAQGAAPRVKLATSAGDIVVVAGVDRLQAGQAVRVEGQTK